MSDRVRTAVMISGRGSNLDALIAASAEPGFPARIVQVLSNNPEAAGLARARAAGIEALAVDHRPFKQDREAHERVLDQALQAARVELVALAGYMRVLTPWFVGRWAGRMINIHPSLLPAFPGLHTHARVLQAGCTIHGCTVHWVTEGVDAGPILGQADVPVLADDTPDSLAARVLQAEHRLYPQCLAKAAEAVRLRRA